MNQRILSIDSQILNTYQSCARKAEYAFVKNVTTIKKAESLESGSLMHDMLEVYYSLQLDHFEFDTPNWKLIKEAGISAPIGRTHDQIRNYAVQTGRFFATLIELHPDETDEVISHFIDYCNHFQYDEWHPLAVEEVGTKTLYEDEELKVLYSFKVDLVAEKGKIIAPFDHKTSKRRVEPTSLSNQFIGYCYGLGMNNLVVNKIGFKKTLTAAQRFNRYILTIDDARIQEWVRNTTHWAKQIARSEESGLWPMNLTSCDKYSGCVYAPICETDPDTRLFKIDRDFKIGRSWDPALELEKR